MAGVSVATVSRAMSRPEKVSDKTRKKVLEAIKATNYKPDVLARNFTTRKSRTIVVLVPDISNPFFSRVIRGIEHAAQRVGYSVLLGDTRGDPAVEDTYASMVEARLADGIIQLNGRLPFGDTSGGEDTSRGDDAGGGAAGSSDTFGRGAESAKKSVPLVNACDCVHGSNVPTIELDNASAAKAMTQHLLSLGHQHIAVVQGPVGSSLTKERLRGHTEALQEAGLALDSRLIAEGDFSAASGEAAVTTLLAAPSMPTAIFCFNDEMAMGAMHSLKKSGYAVPGDISVVGFDDIQFARYCDPPLTTIRQPAEGFGTRAMEVLLGMLEGKEPEVLNQYLPHEIIIRQSSGPVKK